MSGNPNEITTDVDEHDFARDTVLDEMADIDNEAIIASRAHGYVTGGLMVLAGIMTQKSLREFCQHMTEMADEFAIETNGADQ